VTVPKRLIAIYPKANMRIDPNGSGGAKNIGAFGAPRVNGDKKFGQRGLQ
jgi:hypothetical protein